MSWREHRRSNLSIQAILNILEEENIDPAHCLEGTGLRPSDVLNVQEKISDELEISIIERALSLLPSKAGYGIRAGQALRVTTFGIWGLAILASPNLRTAFQTIHRFSELSYTLSTVHLEERGAEAYFVVRMDRLSPSLHAFMFERYYATTVTFLREMLPDFDFNRFALLLPVNDDKYATEISRITGRQVVTRHTEFALRSDRALLDEPLPQADPLTHAHFVGQCQALLREYRELPDYAQSVRDYILQNDTYAPNLEEVAKSIGLSKRSLRRRLQDEETSFSEIVLGTRMALAKELLLTAKLPVQVVASQLDYSEPASFTRAFTQWWGVSPSKVSKQSALKN
ncbi:MAG: AraC family transcriptional regulator ligand-binding domain-containing protein [Henriciella sp.]